MKTIWISAIGLAAATMAAAPALASGHDIVNAPRTDVFTSSATHQGPNVIGSSIHIINGVEQPGNVTGNGGSVAGGGSVTQSWSSAWQDGGVGNNYLHNDSFASANLATGEFKASTTSIGPENFGSPLGFATARMDDTIFFTNTSGGALEVSFTYSFNGQMANPYAANGANPGGYVALQLTCTSTTCYNETGDRIVFANGPTRAPSDVWQYFWSTTGSCFGENIFCGQGAAPYFEWGLNQPNANGVVDGFIRTSLLIPTGESSIGILGSLNLDCRAGSSCDFGHTGLFRFGDLPNGLTFSSASGVFLTDIGGAGVVPEPASWAMMILGFGAVGAAARRRRPAMLAA